MSLNINLNIAETVTDIDSRITALESGQEPFILNAISTPDQSAWESAWLDAGNSLPLPPTQALHWYANGEFMGTYQTLNEPFYLLSPNPGGAWNSASGNRIIGATEDGRYIWGHFVHVGGPGRMRIDGYVESPSDLSMPGTFIRIFGYDPDADIVWGYDNAVPALAYWGPPPTFTKTQVAASPSIPSNLRILADPTVVNDVYLIIQTNGDSQYRLFQWDDSGASLIARQSDLTINGVGTPVSVVMRVIAVTSSYVVVEAAANYWISILRSDWTTEGTIKSAVAGATAANLPAPSAGVTGWNQSIYASDSVNDTLDIVYTRVSGTATDSDWNRIIRFDLALGTYTEITPLPYSQLMTTLAEGFNLTTGLSIFNDAGTERELIFNTSDSFDVTPADLYRPTYAAIYNTVLNESSALFGTFPFIQGAKFTLIEDENMNIHLIPNAENPSSGKVWRTSRWEMNESDSVILYNLDRTQIESGMSLDITNRPPDHNLLEIIIHGHAAAAAATEIKLDPTPGTDQEVMIAEVGIDLTQTGDMHILLAAGSDGLDVLKGDTPASLTRCLIFLDDFPDEITWIKYDYAYGATAGRFRVTVLRTESGTEVTDLYLRVDNDTSGFEGTRALVRALRSTGRYKMKGPDLYGHEFTADP